MAERRTKRGERRTPEVLTLTLFKRSERRGDDRRDWPRLEVAFDVREPSGRRRSCRGDLSVEGAAFVTTAPPLGDVVEVTFHLPTFVEPIVALGRVVSRSGLEDGTQVSVAFTDVELEAELAIAQWCDDLVLAGQPLREAAPALR